MISKEQYVRLYEALWKVNGLSNRDDEDEPIAFVEYHGQINGFNVTTYENGWHPGATKTFHKVLYVDSEDANEEIEDCIRALNDCADANVAYYFGKACEPNEEFNVMDELDKIQASFMATLDEFRKKFGCQDL